MLGPLQDNGGPTFTHALLPGSPAINAGDPDFTPPPFFDQRGAGFGRVANVGSMSALLKCKDRQLLQRPQRQQPRHLRPQQRRRSLQLRQQRHSASKSDAHRDCDTNRVTYSHADTDSERNAYFYAKGHANAEITTHASISSYSSTAPVTEHRPKDQSAEQRSKEDDLTVLVCLESD